MSLPNIANKVNELCGKIQKLSSNKTAALVATVPKNVNTTITFPANSLINLDNVTISKNIIVNNDNTTFTIQISGVYKIIFYINVESITDTAFFLNINNVNDAVITTANQTYIDIIELNAGDVITLETVSVDLTLDVDVTPGIPSTTHFDLLINKI